MAAHVVEAAHLAIFASQRDHRFPEKIERMVVSDPGHITLVADELPARAENGLLLQLEELRVVVDPRRQA